MRTIKLGGREIILTGSVMAAYYYKQEFGQSMGGDLVDYFNKGRVDEIMAMQMVWAMEKATNEGKLDDFETWLGKINWLDISELGKDIFEEAQDAMFREAPKKETEKEEPKPKAK